LTKRFFVALGVTVGIALLCPGHAGASTRSDAAGKAADWIASQQRSNGAFFSEGQRVDETGETIAALVAAGGSAKAVDKALGYLRENGPAGASRGGFTGRIIAGIVAGGEDPRDFGETDYVALLESQWDDATGYDAQNLFGHLLAVNGLLAAKEPVEKKAIRFIRDAQCDNGGFVGASQDGTCSGPPDVDATAWTINVFVASGRAGDSLVKDARAFLLSAQKSDGGFPHAPEFKATRAESTGLALAAVAALDEPATSAPWKRSGGDPVTALVELQDDGGAFRSTPAEKPSGFTTWNALTGLAKRSYPVRPAVKPDPSPDPTQAPSEPTPEATPRAEPENQPRATDSGALPRAPRQIGGVPPRASLRGAAPPEPPAAGRTSSSEPHRSAQGLPDPSINPFDSTTERTTSSLPAIVWGAIAVGFAGTGAAIAFQWLRSRG
jgi:hypothetical protein